MTGHHDPLSDLLERTAARPRRAADPAALRAASRRRTTRRRVAGAGAVVGALAVGGLVIPGLVGSGSPVIEDRVHDRPADRPDRSDDGQRPAGDDGGAGVLDLPEGWHEARIGDAVFGLPPRVTVERLTPTDPPPCTNTDQVSTAHLAPDGFPAATGWCNARWPGVTSLFATPASTLPGDHWSVEDGTVQQVRVSGFRAQRVTWADGEVEPGELHAYRVPELDLWLSFSATWYDPDLVDEVLATVTGAPGAPDPSSAPAPPPGSDRSDDDPPEVFPPGEFTIGEVRFQLPEETTLRQGGDQPPCHGGLDGPTVVALDGLTPGPSRDCPADQPGDTLIAVAPASRVAPAYRPGEGDGGGSADVRAVELLGVDGLEERWTRGDTEVRTLWFDDLDLHLEVWGPELTPGLADQLLAEAERAD